MENRILAVRGEAENFMDIFSDFMIANIHFDVMRGLISSRSFLTKKWFVLAGLLILLGVTVVSLQKAS